MPLSAVPRVLARDLRRRDRQPELMDQPGLAASDHAHALRGLARLNRISRSAEILWPHLKQLARSRPRTAPLRVLDVATGGGDVPVRLARRAARARVPLQITACDISQTALDFAADQAKQAGVAIQFLTHDILAGPPEGDFDVALCSLFLHHLDEPDAVTMLQNLAAAAPSVLVNDLVRSHTGYALVWGAARLLSRSPVVHSDGPLSVRAAFTRPEAHELARRAGLHNITVERRHPCRFLLKAARA